MPFAAEILFAVMVLTLAGLAIGAYAASGRVLHDYYRDLLDDEPLGSR